jgi:hypothetical protein
MADLGAEIILNVQGKETECVSFEVAFFVHNYYHRGCDLTSFEVIIYGPQTLQLVGNSVLAFPLIRS